MVRRASLFSQLVALFHRGQFFNLVYRHQAERHAKGFSSWDYFVAMLNFRLFWTAVILNIEKRMAAGR